MAKGIKKGIQVTAHTNDSVETDVAMAGVAAILKRISNWFDEFPETGEFYDKEKTQPKSYHVIHGSNGERDYMRGLADQALRLLESCPANATTKSKAALKIGEIERDGDHKGEIYGGILPTDKKPIWFSAAPKLMDHSAAAAWARAQGGSLPTRKQGDYLATLKDKGSAFKEIFNRRGLFRAGYVWLAEPSTGGRDFAQWQRLSDGDQDCGYRFTELPILLVRR